MAAIRTAGFQPATECDSHSANMYRKVFEDGIIPTSIWFWDKAAKMAAVRTTGFQPVNTKDKLKRV